MHTRILQRSWEKVPDFDEDAVIRWLLRLAPSVQRPDPLPGVGCHLAEYLLWLTVQSPPMPPCGEKTRLARHSRLRHEQRGLRLKASPRKELGKRNGHQHAWPTVEQWQQSRAPVGSRTPATEQRQRALLPAPFRCSLFIAGQSKAPLALIWPDPLQPTHMWEA